MKNLKRFAKEKARNLKASAMAGAAAITAVATTGVSAHADVGIAGSGSLNSNGLANLNQSSVVANSINLFITIASWGGLIFTAAAIIALVMAVRNEDLEGRNKAILALVTGAALTSAGFIIGAFMA